MHVRCRVLVLFVVLLPPVLEINLHLCQRRRRNLPPPEYALEGHRHPPQFGWPLYFCFLVFFLFFFFALCTIAFIWGPFLPICLWGFLPSSACACTTARIRWILIRLRHLIYVHPSLVKGILISVLRAYDELMMPRWMTTCEQIKLVLNAQKGRENTDPGSAPPR